MKNGVFVISLDFELDWGLHDVLNLKNREKKMEMARIAVEKMLDLYSKYSINVTWATVGLLFCENKAEIEKMSSQIKKPTYENRLYSPYEKMGESLGENEQEDTRHYALSLIRKIKKISGQEIASHTFSHYYAQENGQNIEQFEEDILAFLKVAKRENIDISSIVYPKNQVNYIEVLSKYGIKNYRGNPMFFSIGGLFKQYYLKIARLLDTYIPLSKTTYSAKEIREEKINNVKASRFLRPYSEKLSILEPLKIMRIKKEMEYAAKNGEVYHIWWHPHNFSDNLEKNLKQLEEILTHYAYLNNKCGFQTMSMEQLGESITK